MQKPRSTETEKAGLRSGGSRVDSSSRSDELSAFPRAEQAGAFPDTGSRSRVLRGMVTNRRWLGTILVEAIAAFSVLSVCVIWISGLDAPLADAVPFASMTFGVILITGAVTLIINRRTIPVTRALLIAGAGMVGYTTLLAVTRSYYSLSILAVGFVVAVLTCVQVGLMITKNRFLRIGVLPFAEQERFFSLVGTSGLTLISSAEDISDFDMLVVDPQDLSNPTTSETLEKAFLNGTEIIAWNEFVEERKGRVVLDRFNVGGLEWSAQQRVYLLVKRVADLTAALLLALPAVILVAFAAIATKFSNGGPILFAQKRVGRGGALYTMYKLRTMRDGPRLAVATTQADSRITPIGNILRRYRIDELPQLWNIIRGDMSFIGPRPEQPELVTRYISEIRGFNSRHAVTPGISGWAQVKFGYAANTSETSEKVSYDLFYVKNISFDLDLRIVFKTIGTILGGTGAR